MGEGVTCHIAIVVTKLGATELLSPILSLSSAFCWLQEQELISLLSLCPEAWPLYVIDYNCKITISSVKVNAPVKFRNLFSQRLLLHILTQICLLIILLLQWESVYLFFNVAIVCIVVGRVSVVLALDAKDYCFKLSCGKEFLTYSVYI